METKDRHLDTPSEANRVNDINFQALENNEPDPADAPAVGELAADDPNNDQKEQIFDIVLDGVSYLVKVTPFEFNQDMRYYVSVDDGPTNLFLWDVEMKQIRSLDDTASVLPDGLEKEISDRLMSGERENVT